jgi:mono/diheme cytochrome c family protein
MRHFLIVLCAITLLAACSRGDDAAETAAPEVTEKFAANHFLQYLNQQPSLAPGTYEIFIDVPGPAADYTLEVTQDDGGVTQSSGSLSTGVNVVELVELSRAGGLDVTVSASAPVCLYLQHLVSGVILHRAGDSDTSDIDCDTGATAASIDLPTSKTNDASYAAAYYATIDPTDARATLAGFQAVNNFGAGDTHVIFRDTKDLGYGRDMYFHDNGDGTYAFYVNNFAITDLPGVNYGPLNLDAAIAQVSKYHIGTNAIEYGPLDADGDGVPDGVDINGDGNFDAADYFPRFYNFSSTPPYERRDTVNLDGKGDKAMPVPCIVCHGGRADTLLPDGSFPRSGDTFSQLQPLDVGTFEYADASPWTRAEVEVGLKAINTAVYDSYAALETPPLGQWDSSMAREMLEGWYGGAGLPAAFDDDYVPAGWQHDPSFGSPPAGSDDLYREVLSTNCRTCHLLRGLPGGTGFGTDIDFTSWDKFIGYDARIEELVFDQGLMPLATLTFDNFHDSGFLAEMLASFLPDFSRFDDAGALLLPGRPIADAGPDRASPAPVSVSGTASDFAEEYQWSIVSQPTGANAALSGADTVRATLDNAIDGSYVLALTVSLGSVTSEPDTVTVLVDSGMSPAPQDLTFTTHIAPVLTTATCTGCHTDGNNPLPPVLYTPGPNRDVYQTVRSLVNFDDPLNSRLLLKPSGHHHAGGQLAGFDLAGNRANYDLFLNWILEGAPE